MSAIAFALPPVTMQVSPAQTDHGLHLVEPAQADGLPLLLFKPGGSTQAVPLAVCVHGYTRQPLDQLRAFAPLAERLGFALALPLFDDRRHRRYQQLLHPRLRTRSDLALLQALDAAAGRHGIDAKRLFLFGYSGGAQFVHRFAMCHPQRTAALAVGAAGWYTWPDMHHDWPLGLANAHDRLEQPICLRRFVQLPMAVWVGERDTAADEHLRDEAQLAAMQGAHRLDRAHNWAQAVRDAGRACGVSNDVPVTVLARVGHDFASCHRKAGLAGQVMDFFDRHR